jgi:hypothetical protein
MNSINDLYISYESNYIFSEDSDDYTIQISVVVPRELETLFESILDRTILDFNVDSYMSTDSEIIAEIDVYYGFSEDPYEINEYQYAQLVASKNINNFSAICDEFCLPLCY